MDMQFYHWSGEAVTSVNSVAQDGLDMKPKGFWLSVGTEDGGDEWKEWCEGDGFRTERLVHRHVVTLKPSANVFWIDRPEEMAGFTMLYGEPMPGHGLLFTYIDWRKVAADADGIVIAPYIWEERLTARSYWYYTWDVASGCIWNADAIASIEEERT